MQNCGLVAVAVVIQFITDIALAPLCDPSDLMLVGAWSRDLLFLVSSLDLAYWLIPRSADIAHIMVSDWRQVKPRYPEPPYPLNPQKPAAGTPNT